jgi:hypothetical protein
VPTSTFAQSSTVIDEPAATAATAVPRATNSAAARALARPGAPQRRGAANG